MVPKKWGQGQLFAFSALDGEAFFSDDLSGTLTGDKMGIDPSRCLFFKRGYYQKAVEAMGDWRNNTPIDIKKD